MSYKALAEARRVAIELSWPDETWHTLLAASHHPPGQAPAFRPIVAVQVILGAGGAAPLNFVLYPPCY